MAKTKVELQNYQGESLSPITIASNVLYEDGRNAQEVFEEYSNETFTPTIENSSSMFKVGQGDSVDYSGNIVNGAYESMVLKGKTMVNCIQEPSSKDVVLPYEFEEGRYVTINDTKESGALGVELKGQTLVNLLGELATDLNNNLWSEDENNYILDLATGNGQPTLSFRTLYTLPANKTYTLFINMTSYVTGVIHIDFRTPSNTSSSSNQRHFGEAGWQKLVFTTTEETASVRMFNRNGVDNTFSIGKSLILLEGDHTNTPIPNYFTGMTSCKMPILHTVGKNLFDMNRPYDVITDSQATVVQDTNQITVSSANSGTYVSANFILDKDFFAGKTVTGSCLYESDIKDIGTVQITYQDGNGDHHYQWIRTPKTFTFPNNFIGDVMLCVCANNTGTPQSNTVTVKNIQLELGSTATTYEAHKSSILSLPEEVVLRSLPNGAKDTLNLNTGEYVQRIKEITFDGSNDEGWVVSSQTNSTTQCFDISVAGASSNNDGYIATFCDKFPSYTASHLWSYEKEGVGNPSSRIRLRLNATRLSTVDVAGLRTYLQSNPITVQYELTTPIITKINLSSTLKSWNTTTHIYSEIPENTLYPTLSHSNPTYPVILKPSTKYSIVANSYSNNHTNSAINFNLGGATASTTVGNRVTTITTPSTLSNELLTMSGRGNKLNNVMVIEGDVAGDEPYFEGMCDSKSPILSNVGKNLFDINNHTENQWSFSSGYPYEQNTSYGDRLKILGDEIHFSTDGGTVNKGVGYYIPLCKNKDYTFRINKKNGNGNYCVKLFLIHSSEYPLKQAIQQHSKFGINNEVITSSLEANFNSANYDMCAIYIGGGWESGTHIIRSYVFNNISLTESNQQVEPYKSNTTTFDQKDGKTIVLRSLPSGVCDTLNVETGEYVQRIGEVVFDGSSDEVMWFNTGWTNGECVACYWDVSRMSQPNKKFGITNMVCDKFPTVRASIVNPGGKINREGIWGEGGSGVMYISLNKTKLTELNANGFRQWASQNPVTVQYELETPIVSTIDVQGFPYAYANGHVQLSSGSIEQSLTPKVEYSVATNRNGQIRSNQKMVERHQKQLDQLQAIILANMVNTQYQQTLTTLNYDLLKKEVGE